MHYAPGVRGFYAFCRDVGYDLAPFQRVIARAALGDAREVAACLPRGSAKSTLAALIALHHVLSTPDASVYIGAAAREQARIIGRIVDRYARHEAIAGLLTVRHDEVRVGDRHAPTALRIVASDGGRALGWERPTLMIGDEVLAWNDREPSLLGAMTTSLVKNPAAKLLLISTAPLTAATPWGQVRRRAMAAPDLRRDGAFLEARGNGLHWVEWSLPDDDSPDDIAAVKRATPAPWVTHAMLTEQRHRTTEQQWLSLHCNRAHANSARWLPTGAWQAARASYGVDDHEPLTLGVDVGGARAGTALVGMVGDQDLVRVALVEVWQTRRAVFPLIDYIEQLIASGRRIREVVYDPMRFDSEAQRLERDHGLTVVEWPQSPTRMTRCSEHLHRLIIEGRLQHYGDRDLDAHVANAVAVPTPRGWRLDKEADADQIDAVIALAMAAERASVPARLSKFVGMAGVG